MSEIVKNYSGHTKWRSECVRVFGATKDLPIANPTRIGRDLFAKEKGNVLDFGCGMNSLTKRGLRIPDSNYFTLDSDPDGQFDFASLSDIPQGKRFSLVVMNQVIEHIRFQQTLALMKQLRPYLTTDGHLIITVPNMSHPVRYWGDIDHVTTWTHEDIYGLLKNSGFGVVNFGRYNKRRLPFNPIKRYVVKTVCDVFRVDWCDSLFCMARKL
jgi:hypothetical protein